MIGFEFDPEKSANNERKHGIDFIEAQKLWADPDVLEVPARVTDEARYLVVGRIEGKFWSAVTTYRAGNVRIISVRRSREGEIKGYESKRV